MHLPETALFHPRLLWFDSSILNTHPAYVNVTCVSQSKLVVVPDNMAAGLLRAVSRLLDLSVLPVEPMLRFLSQCCFSLLTLLISLQQELPAETNHKR